MKEPIYDVAIAGAGISGLLAAARLGESIPDINIIVVEKEQVLGGRLRTNGGEAGSWSCGLNAVSSELYEFACKSFNLHEDKEDLPSFVNETQSKIGILSGGKIANIDVADVYGRQGARKLGGITAQKSWDKVEDLLFPHDLAHDTASQAMGKAWKHTRKNPAAIVMEHFACSFGVADLWQSTVQAIRERSKAFQQGSITGEWERAFSDLLNREPLKSAISLKTNCHIIEAKRIGDIWKIETEQGTFSTENLIVAQAPWVALDWLAKEYWPVPLLDLTLKTKPVSLVALTSEIEEYVELPDLTYITSEKTIVSVRGKKEICFKALLDFEISLDAPEVVKAIKRLRRAKKKLLAQVEGLQISGEYLKLIPYAWPQSTAQSDLRHIKSFEKKAINNHNLAYCGDAYGPSYVGDHNIQTSVIAACEYISQEIFNKRLKH